MTSMTLWFALLMIVAMALLHRAGMSSRLGGSVRRRTSLACVCVCVVCCGSDINDLVVFGLGSIRFALFLSFVMRFSCLVSNLVIRGCSLVLA
jgi:hypothetical protein